MRRLQDYSDYAVTRDGRVWSYKYHKFLKPTANKKSYLQVGIYSGGKRSTKLVHHLVAKAYLNNQNNLTVVNHLDSDRQNNHVTNLEWCSTRENNLHTLKKGRNQPKLTAEIVKALRRESETTDLSYRNLGRKYGISGVMVSRIIRRLSWDYV